MNKNILVVQEQNLFSAIFAFRTGRPWRCTTSLKRRRKEGGKSYWEIRKRSRK